MLPEEEAQRRTRLGRRGLYGPTTRELLFHSASEYDLRVRGCSVGHRHLVSGGVGSEILPRQDSPADLSPFRGLWSATSERPKSAVWSSMPKFER